MESHAHLQKDLQGKIVTVEHMEQAKPKQLLKTNHYTNPASPPIQMIQILKEIWTMVLRNQELYPQ